jgi:exo-beta-1,3-glucanase (GH17 family)
MLQIVNSKTVKINVYMSRQACLERLRKIMEHLNQNIGAGVLSTNPRFPNAKQESYL